MRVNIIDGRRDHIGSAPVKVLVDVFRSTSTMPVLLKNGARTVVPSRSVRGARKLYRNDPDFILIGERFGIKVPGFHYNNSPSDVWDVDFSGKNISFTSTNGTRVLEKIKHFPGVFISSFINHSATVAAVSGAEDVEIVMSGRPDSKSDEDLAYSEFLRDSLAGKNPGFETCAEKVRASSGARRLAVLGYKDDVEKCLVLDHVDFPVKYLDGKVIRS